MPRVFELFPTPVFESGITPCEEWVRFASDISYGRDPRDPNSISIDKNVLDSIPVLKEEITNACKVYAYEYLGVMQHNDVYISRSWCVKHTKGDWAGLHAHINSIWSGIYYLKCDDHSGNVVFEKSWGHDTCFTSTMQPDHMINHYNQNAFSFTPVEGTLLIFPSHLQHKVLESHSVKERYCIAFDVYIKGEIGYMNGNGISL